MHLNVRHKEIISHRPIECIIDVAYDYDDINDSPLAMRFTDSEDAEKFVETTIDKWLQESIIDFSQLTECEQFIIGDIIDGSTTAASLVEDFDMKRIIPFDGEADNYRAICCAGKQLAKEYSKYHNHILFPVA